MGVYFLALYLDYSLCCSTGVIIMLLGYLKISFTPQNTFFFCSNTSSYYIMVQSASFKKNKQNLDGWICLIKRTSNDGYFSVGWNMEQRLFKGASDTKSCAKSVDCCTISPLPLACTHTLQEWTTRVSSVDCAAAGELDTKWLTGIVSAPGL